MKTLANCQNLFGEPLSPDAKNCIRRFLSNPTADNWNNICGIIIKPPGVESTIWNAVVQLDPAFPLKGRITDIEGNVLKEWERVPTPFQVLKAIRRFTDQTACLEKKSV